MTTGDANGPVSRTKRGHGEGSYTQRADGTWQGRVMVGRLPDGRPDRRSVSAATRREVQLLLKELIGRKDAGALPNRDVQRLTLGTYLERWLTGKRGTVRDTTWRTYRLLCDQHILPALGHLPLAQLHPESVRAWQAGLLVAPRGAGAPLSPRTVAYARGTLRLALAQAVADGDLLRNVADAVRPPRQTSPEFPVLDASQVQRLLAQAARAVDAARVGRDTYFATNILAFVTLAAHTGARAGELLALQWPDIDRATTPGGARLTIQRTLTQLGTSDAPVFHAPKTAAGRRTLPLTPPAMAALRLVRVAQAELRLALGPDHADHNLVFAAVTGAPLGHQNVLKAYRRLLADAGLPIRARLHDLRHSAATLMLASGVGVRAVSAILGHANGQVTMTIYAHLLSGDTDRGIARLGEVLTAPSSPTGTHGTAR